MSDLLQYIATQDAGDIPGEHNTEASRRCKKIITNGGSDEDILEAILYCYQFISLLSDDQFIRLYSELWICDSSLNLWNHRTPEVLLAVMKNHDIPSRVIVYVWSMYPDTFPLEQVLDLYRHKLFRWGEVFLHVETESILESDPSVWVEFIKRDIKIYMDHQNYHTCDVFIRSLVEAHKIYREMCDNYQVKSAARD